MKIRWWWCWQPLMTVVMAVVISMLDMTISDPQINLVHRACSRSTATMDFFNRLNDTFSNVRNKLFINNTHFVSANNFMPSYHCYTMAQCRNYLSTTDCVACFNAAVSEILTCSPAIGAHVTYDGCFLRYENYFFDNQGTAPGYGEKCGNQTAFRPTAFDEAVKGSLADLVVATPKIKFAAIKREVAGGSTSVYAVAQCAETVTENGCEDCMKVAYDSITKCTPFADGRSIDVGCFLRYSETTFFADNQTTNITPFLAPGSTGYNQTTPFFGGRSTGDNQTTPFFGGGSTGDRISDRLKIIIGISAGVFGIVLVSVLMIIHYLKINDLLGNAKVFWRKKARNDQNVEALMKNYGSLAPKRYKYSDIKRMTNSFKDKVGGGGYGVVYKGKLFDSRLVAVKVLNKTKGNGEEFINEVACISRTSHVNVVTLLGFCYERNKRALVYEFISNGSLDKFIYNDGSLNSNCHLDCKKLYQIAVGVARGLEYLHRGCNTRIVHFDIKPQNILLDDDFCPKISDFGLAKLGQRKKSIMSMVSARGTIGYIAPEVFFRNFGGVSHKSDVYSYGMMVFEMVGGRKDIEADTAHSSEVHFLDCIYEQLEHNEDTRLNGVTTEEENETVRKMTIVSLWCIQTNPANRPSMTTVVEMLEGSFQSLQIPPKPFLFSPTQLAQDSLASLSCNS